MLISETLLVISFFIELYWLDVMSRSNFVRSPATISKHIAAILTDGDRMYSGTARANNSYNTPFIQFEMPVFLK